MTTATATVLFCDVVDSTGHRARLGEVEADRLFRAHEKLLRDLVALRAGRVLKGAGDGVMAVFAAASDGVAAAAAIQQGVRAATPELRVRVGVAAGDVSWEGDDCFGLPVVIAARLESAAEPGGILVAAVVRHMAGDRTSVIYSPLEPLELKGIPEPVEAFSIDWETACPGLAGWQFPSTLPSESRQPFVGRAGEQDQLRQLWSETTQGNGGVVLLGGEAGAGKTRLATELARRCSEDGAIVLCGLCDSELSLPYQPWVMALDQLVAQLPDRVREGLRDELGRLRVLVPRIERLVGGLPTSAPLSPEAERHELFTAIASVLRASSELAPIVLVLDDLHWAGQQTLSLLRFIARTSPVDRLLIVGTFRDTGDEIAESLASLLAGLRREARVTRVKLEGIGVDDVFELLSAIGAVGDLEASAAAIAQRTRGNPFLVSELSLYASLTDGESVPESVMEVVAGRLQRLTEPARHLAMIIAVGGRLELPVLRESVMGKVPDVGAALSELLQAGLVQELTGPVPLYQFTHALIREAVSASLPSFSRSEIHLAVALALERTHEADRRPVVAELTRHFAAAAPVAGWEKAAYYGRRAASQARRTAAYDEAIGLLEVALDVVPDQRSERASLLIDMADLMERCGRHPHATDLAEQAYSTARAAGNVEMEADAAMEFERAAHLRNGPVERAVPMLEGALRRSEHLSCALRVRLRASLGRAKALVGHPDAEAVVAQALEEARALGDDETTSHALEVACVTESDPLVLLEHVTELEQLTAATGDIFQSEWAAGMETCALIMLGRLTDARKVLSRLQERAITYHFITFQWEARVFTSSLALTAAHFEEAEAAAESANVAEEDLYNGIEASGAYGLQMFMIRREQGRLGEMRPFLQILCVSDRASGIWGPGLVAAYAELDMLDEARRGFDELAVDDFSGLPRDTVWPLTLAFLSDACIKLGDQAAARVLLRELAPFGGLVLTAGFTTCDGPADRCRAALAELCGDRDAADAFIVDAAELAETSGSPLWMARVEQAWAWIAAQRGDREGVAAHFGRARALAEEFGIGSVSSDPPCQILVVSDAESVAVDELPDGLSSREVEVLALLAEGRTNRAIAETLFISPNTAANHVRSILRKTASSNRTEAAAYAIRHGLNVPNAKAMSA